MHQSGERKGVAERDHLAAAGAQSSSPSRAEELQALGDLIVALTESHSIGKIFFLLGRKLKSLLHPEVVQVWMLGEDGRELHQVLSQADDHRLAEVLAEHKIEELATSPFTSAETVRRREIVIRRAGEGVPDRMAAIMADGKIEMSVSVPIVARDEVHGAINMMFRQARAFDREDLRFLDALGRTVAAAIENARLVEDLNRERRWLGTILDELPSGILIAEGEDARLTHSNKAFRKMLGSIDGLKGPDFPARFQARDCKTGAVLKWEDTALATILARGEPAVVEYDIVGDDGVRRSMLVHGAPLKDPRGQEPIAVVAMQDVTPLKKLERQNRRQAQLLQLTLENVPAGIALLDAAELRFVEVNENFARFFQDPQVARESLLGRKVSELYSDFELSGLAAIVRGVRETRVPFTAAAFELEGFRGGSTYWNVSLLPLEDDGRVENLLLFAVEVTSLIETQGRLRAALEGAEAAGERLEAANRELIEAGRVKDEFLSTLSHELRTPLTPILGWTRILKAHGAETALLEQGLRAIERNVIVQVRLVDDLLDLSRLAYDKVHLELEKVELNTLLREAWEQVRPDAEAKQIELVTELAAVPLMLEGDRLRLRQVFVNLLTNAVKFSEEGSRVTLSSRATGEGVVMEVADEGIGIEPEFLPRIFERFQQADASTTRRHGGLGIGLSIAKSLVEMHGGTIAVESPGPGQGSRFRVTLPVPADHGAGAAEFGSSGILKGIRVLLADDDPDTIEVISRLLELEGAEVITATTGLEAIDQALERSPDVLLCDLQMADVDGYEVAESLRAAPEATGVRLVALSGHGALADLESANRAGFEAHLLKPVQPEHLFAAILQVLGRTPLVGGEESAEGEPPGET